MAKIYNNNPYYEYFDKKKGYVKMLAVPERGAQSVEWNIMQSMLLSFIKDIGDSIYEDGNIVEGCAVKITGNKVTIEPGRVYMDGLIHNIDGATLTISGVGTEYIGVVLNEEIVTENEDADFYDPAVGSANYLHPGCHRVKQSVHFEANNPLSAVVATFVDGNIKSITEERPVTDTITEVLARRTFDESGNYVVSGFEMLDGNNVTEDGILINLNKGKAYVKGYEVQKPVGTSFRVRKSTDTRTMYNEPHVLQSSVNTYTLNNIPVKQVTRVSATVSTVETMTRGQVTGTSDTPKHGSIVEIKSITSGPTTYTAGYDYILTKDKIDWSPSGAEPDPGANYTVKYTYKAVLQENTDFRVTQTDSNTNVVIINNNVASGTEMLIDYDYYLARKDSVCLDKTGGIVITEGQPNFATLCEAPIITDNSILPIGSILCMPNSNKIIITNATTKVSTMEKIQKTIKKVDDLEYNMSLSDLDNEAMAGEVITDLKGILTEGFINFNKSDIGRSDVDYSIGEQDNMILPYTEYTTNMSVKTDPTNSYKALGTNWVCPYTETLVISQPHVTGSMKVNPYQVFEPMLNVSITPEFDNWIDTTNVVVEKVVETESAKIERWWRHPNMNVDKAEEYRQIMSNMGIDVSNYQVGNMYDWTLGGLFDDSLNMGASNGWRGVYTNNETLGSRKGVASDTLSLYMRPISIKLSSSTCLPNEEVKVKFAGREVNLTPLGSTLQGSSSKTVKANANSYVECSFTIPEKVPCGVVEVTLESVSNPGRVARTSFTAQGRDQVIEETIYIKRSVIETTDPLAQSFVVNEDCNITSIDLYFTQKDGNTPVNVQVRGMTNGFPNNIVYSEKLVQGSEITVSSDASFPTRVTFPNIINCEANVQYCVVILTDSPNISLGIAQLGERDIREDKYILSNPYSTGVLFSSSNATTWTAHQDKDLKFNLYRANYSSTGSIVFNNVSLNSIDRFMLALEHIVPIGCKAEFSVSINNGSYHPYTPWVDYSLSLNATVASIKVNMSSTGYLSPVISSVSPKVFGSKNKLQAVYISKNIVMDTPFNSIKVYFDAFRKQGTEYEVYYATDTQGSAWKKMTLTSTKILSESFQQNYYEVSLDSPVTDYRVKVVMKTTNSYIRPTVKRLMNVLRDI